MTAPAPCRYKDKSPQASSEETSARRVPILRELELEPLKDVVWDDVARETLTLRKWKESPRWEQQAKKAAAFEPHYPSHVRACANNELISMPWVLHFWKRNNPETRQKQVYTCGSYRCPSPACQKHAAHTDFARIVAALDEKDPQGNQLRDSKGWVFLVLTIDQNHTYGTGKEYENEQQAFKQLSENTRFFLRRLRGHQKRNGWRVLENEWVGTIEVQRNGWPHMNLILYSPELAAELKSEAPPKGRQLVQGWLKTMVTETNWGTISTAEGARSRDALAGYVVKLAGDFQRKAGEIAKITQAPVNAKMKLRRIRAGRGFLPPQRNSESEWTGAMFKREVIHGRIVSGPMIQPDMVKPVGDTPEEQLKNYELYASGVRAAMIDERESILIEERDLEMVKAGGFNSLLVALKYADERRKLRNLFEERKLLE